MHEPTAPVLSGMTQEELAELILPEPRFRAAQVFKWIASGVSSFDQMANLPLSLRREFSTRYLPRPKTDVTRHCGKDGTVKLAVRFADGACIEAVLLADTSKEGTREPLNKSVESAVPADFQSDAFAPCGAQMRSSSTDLIPIGLNQCFPRYTACLSTQVGCPAGCVFCKTGSMGFVRNLTSAEIVEQVLLLGAESKKTGQESSLSNIVVMGMGEPFLNLEQLRGAFAVISDARGMNFSRRRITVSTCGIVRGITDLADNGPAVRLALSLTTADEELRQRLMPFTAKHPLGEVKEALRYFQEKGGGRITLEAVLLGGINMRVKDAHDIARFAEGLDATVNLIPWNPVKGLEFEGKALREPPPAEVEDFARRLKALGLNVTRRFRRGRGVMGACGQLGNR